MLTFAIKKKRTSSITPKRQVPITSKIAPSSHLQQTRVRQILHGPTLQPKLTIGQPNDKYEQEADRVTDEVMRMPEPELQRQPLEGEENGAEAFIQPKSLAALSADLEPGFDVRIQSFRGGQPLSLFERAFFEPRFGQDFSQVRIHTDSYAAETARAINAQAFTVGHDIVFGPDRYMPSTARGRRLLAHELTHVVQQSGPVQNGEPVAAVSRTILPLLQRRIAETDLLTAPVERIMADETYFENGITQIAFFSAELAILYYRDGSTIRLGLVPKYIQAPFEGVDYRTPRMELFPILSTKGSLGTGAIRFIPHFRHIKAPPGTSFGQIIQAAGRRIRFRIHRSSGRIVPTEVNSISAPRLSKVLRSTEAKYVKSMNQFARGAIQTLRILKWVVILASMGGGLSTGGGSRAAAGRATARWAGAKGVSRIAARAQSRLSRFFLKLFRTGSKESITLEGVHFSTVRVSSRGTQFLVQRFGIQNISRIMGRGRLLHGAFEQAAIQAARQAGARTAKVALETVINSSWRAYLESLGYATELVPHASGGFQVLWVKVFTL